ncbi:ATP-binding protein [Brumimicrobium salinarum]|uniref:ATP-binding protein n=1 Tax=Brumimicrobium salinarum TaxID=2058658 RepID=UPI0037429EAD
MLFFGQSDVRNKVLAPVFKRLGIIEQWGNRLQLIADDLKEYPEIDLTWKAPGVVFRVSFIKKEYKKNKWYSMSYSRSCSMSQVGKKFAKSWVQGWV